MVTAGTMTSLRYMRRDLLNPTHDVQENYFREIINHYGVDADYYRHDARFFESPSSVFVNNIYGEKPTMSYWLSGHVIVYLNVTNDNLIMDKFGIETDMDGTCYFMKNDFTHQFRDKIGVSTTDTFDIFVSGNVENYNTTISGSIINSDLTGYVQDSFTVNDYTLLSGIDYYDTSANFESQYIDIPVKHNPLLYKSETFNTRTTYGDMTGLLTGELDLSGNGIISGNITGTIQYVTDDPGINDGENWGISPQVGDFIRLDFDDDNHEEYTITRIYDRKLKYRGVNPLLEKYMWVCDIVRRDPSYEEVVGTDSGNNKEEPWTTDKSDLATIYENVSKEIFDYDTNQVDSYDLENSDDVYGGY